MAKAQKEATRGVTGSGRLGRGPKKKKNTGAGLVRLSGKERNGIQIKKTRPRRALVKKGESEEGGGGFRTLMTSVPLTRP